MTREGSYFTGLLRKVDKSLDSLQSSTQASPFATVPPIQDSGPPPVTAQQSQIGLLAFQEVKHEVDKLSDSLQSSKQASPLAMVPSIQDSRPPPVTAQQSQTGLVTGAGQPSKPDVQMGSPGQHYTSQAPGQIQLPQPQSQPPGPGTVSLPEKPLTSWTEGRPPMDRKKLREEEARRTEEESLKKLQHTPSGAVMCAHQWLPPHHPQPSTPQLSSCQINEQSYGHLPGFESHQAEMQTPSGNRAVAHKESAESTPAQQPPSKKQKVSAGEPDQTIRQLNDVTTVGGVNLKDEAEQLLVGPEVVSCTTEAMRRIVQQEEERPFRQIVPLRAKVAAIATRCGVESVSEDVERCISMAVEERLRSMLPRLIKLSKQRCDVNKEENEVVTTSDTRREILLMRKKAKELQEKKMAEENERLRKLHEREARQKGKGCMTQAEMEELNAKVQKAQQEEEDRLKRKAANAAARAAVGAEDMLLRWQMMSETGRKRREGESRAAEEGAATQGGPANAGPGPGGVPPLYSGRRVLTSKPVIRVERSITLKDVIAFLETDTEMSKSTFLYRLYERQRKTVNEKNGHSGNQT